MKNSSLAQQNQVNYTNSKGFQTAQEMKMLSYSDMITEGNYKNDPSEYKGRRNIRIRFQFKATDIPVGKNFGEQIKQKGS